MTPRQPANPVLAEEKSGAPAAIPSFPECRDRIEASDRALQEEKKHLIGLMRVLGTPMIRDGHADFIYYNPFAREVRLAGEFASWGWNGVPMQRLGETGFFHCTVDIAAPARIEYKFSVDGNWALDPYCPNRVDNGVGGENSYFVLGKFEEPPELEWLASVPHGKIEEFVFSSQYLHNRRNVFVYLPPDYPGNAGETKYPSLYVHDGGEYLNRARFAVAMDNLIAAKSLQPLIVVMVNPVDREGEYIGNENYAQMIERELIPHIDRTYPTAADRDSRGVMGASMGGLISTYLALTRPHLFSKVAGQSSAFFLNEEKVMSLARSLNEKVRFYFDVGNVESEFIPAHKKLLPILESRGSKCFYQEVQGGHNWTTWRAHLKDMLAYLWEK